jgi:hypothetical protein
MFALLFRESLHAIILFFHPVRVIPDNFEKRQRVGVPNLGWSPPVLGGAEIEYPFTAAATSSATALVFFFPGLPGCGKS